MLTGNEIEDLYSTLSQISEYTAVRILSIVT